MPRWLKVNKFNNNCIERQVANLYVSKRYNIPHPGYRFDGVAHH